MRNLFLLSFCFIAVSTWAQKSGKPDRYAKTITPADLKKRLYIVAGPEMEGRETGTEGQHRAAAYIEGEFKKLGLAPGANGGYQMPYNVYQDSLVKAALEVGGQPFQLNKDFSYSSENISATMRFSKAVVFAPDAIDSMRTANLAGKLVLLLAKDPVAYANPLRTAMFQLLRDKGAAAILLVNTFRINVYSSRRVIQAISQYKEKLSPQLFFINEGVARAIAGTDYEALHSGSQAVKTCTTEVMLNVQKQPLPPLQASNVLGVLEGTDLKDQYLFITAHYDHLGKKGDSVIYYGADDDGSGTVSVLELAEAFTQAKKAGHGPRRTIVFMTVSGEEKGLWGSEYYTDHPLFPLEKTTADLNIDMIGRADSSRTDSSNYVYVVGDDKVSSELKPISEAANQRYTKLKLDYKFNDPNDKNQIYFRSDHYNFAKHGVPIIFYYDGMLGADYHKPTDTPDKIHYDLMAKRAQLVFYTAWDMANRPEPIKRDLGVPSMAR